MPIRYYTNKPLHCDKLDAGLKNSIQGCKYESNEKPKFSPHNKKNININDSLIKPIKHSVAPVYHPSNNPMLNPLSVSPIPVIQTPISNNNYLSNNNQNYNESFSNNDKHKVNTKVTFFTEKMRQKHLDFVKTFRDHPNFTPMDQTAAVFSNASYLDGADDINNYLKSVGEENWRLTTDEKMNNEWMKTFINNDGEIAVAYRGTVSWLKYDGIANLSNTVQTTELRQAIADTTQIDIRTRKARVIEETNTYIADMHKDKVVLTTGHSQGGRDSNQARLSHFDSAETINFDPAPRGGVPKKYGKSWATNTDIVSTGAKIQGAVNPFKYEVNTVKSIENSLVNNFTSGHSVGNFTQEIENNMSAGETTPLLGGKNKTSNLASGIKNIGRSGAIGAVGLGADMFIENVGGDQNEHLKTAEKSGVTSVGTKAASVLLGAPTVGASTMILPLFASFEAANATDKALTDELDKSNLNTTQKE